MQMQKFYALNSNVRVQIWIYIYRFKHTQTKSGIAELEFEFGIRIEKIGIGIGIQNWKSDLELRKIGSGGILFLLLVPRKREGGK